MFTTYEIHFMNRRGARLWVLPLAGTTIGRMPGNMCLLPACERLGRKPLRFEYHDAVRVMDAINRHLRVLGKPGRCVLSIVPGWGVESVRVRKTYGVIKLREADRQAFANVEGPTSQP